MGQQFDSPAAETAATDDPTAPEAPPGAPSANPSRPLAPTDEDGAPPPDGYDPADYRWVPVRRR